MSAYSTRCDSGLFLNFQYVWARICTVLVGRVFDILIGYEDSLRDSSSHTFDWVAIDGAALPECLRAEAYPNHLKGMVRWFADSEIQDQLWRHRLDSTELVHPSVLPQALSMLKFLHAGRDSAIVARVKYLHLDTKRGVTIENVAAFVYAMALIKDGGDGAVPLRRSALEVLGLLTRDPFMDEPMTDSEKRQNFDALLEAVSVFCVNLRVVAGYDIRR